MTPNVPVRLLTDLIDYLRPYHLLFGAVLTLVVLIGGYAANCEGLGDGWPGSATRGLMKLGIYERHVYEPHPSHNDQDLVISHHVATSVCGEQTSEAWWFRIRLAVLFNPRAPLSRDDFEVHRGEIPEAVQATLRRLAYGTNYHEPWPPKLAVKYGDCMVWSSGAVVSDCTGERRTVKLPALIADDSDGLHETWWRFPMRILGAPFALVFDVLTTPLNAVVVALLVFPVYFQEPAPKRRYYWRVGLAIALACDVVALIVLVRLNLGHVTSRLWESNGLVGAAGPGGAVVWGAIIPAVSGFVIAKETRRQSFSAMGVFGALASIVVLLVLLLFAEDVIDEAEDLPGVIAMLLNPVTLVPSLIALGIVIRGAKHVRGVT